MATETANPIKYIRKHLNQQARRTGSPLLGKDWEKHAAITDPEHHYRHMQVHEDAAEREHSAGNHAKAEKHRHWAKGHHALARNKMSHIEWRPNIVHSSAESTHRVGVTVSEPDHPSVSQRGDHHQRTFRTKATSPEHAVSKAHQHYKKQGYQVHDAWHIEQAAIDPELVSKFTNHPLVQEHPHSVFHQHDGSKHHVEFGGDELEHEKSGHGSHEDLHTAIVHASSDYHHRNKKWSSAASVEETAGHSADTKWWNSLSSEQRHHYLRLHPDSKFAHHGEASIPGKDHSKRIAQEAKLAGAHIRHLHNNMHSNQVMNNMDEVHKHMHKLGNVLHKMGERHSKGKPASAAHIDFLSKFKTPHYAAGKPHPHVASMVHSAKKHLKLAHGEAKSGDVDNLAAMYAADAADHFKIGHHISKGEHKKAERLMDHLDTASRDEIPSRVWNHYNKDD